MVERHQAAAAVDGDAHGIEADLIGVRPSWCIDEPRGREAPHLLGLAWRDRFEGRPSVAPRAARLDLDEHESARAVRDEVDLAEPRAGVLRDDLEPSPAEVFGGEVLSGDGQCGALVGCHGGDRTPGNAGSRQAGVSWHSFC